MANIIRFEKKFSINLDKVYWIAPYDNGDKELEEHWTYFSFDGEPMDEEIVWEINHDPDKRYLSKPIIGAIVDLPFEEVMKIIGEQSNDPIR